MQGKEENILTSTDQIKAFQRTRFGKETVEGNLKMFPLVSNTLRETLPVIDEYLRSYGESLPWPSIFLI